MSNMQYNLGLGELRYELPSQEQPLCAKGEGELLILVPSVPRERARVRVNLAIHTRIWLTPSCANSNAIIPIALCSRKNLLFSF